MKFIILLSACVAIIQAQRPSYASSGPIGRPGLASRFKEDNASSSSTSTTVNFENRVGESSSTQKIPVDARGDSELVDTLNSWDREHQPFWFINADHIEKARNTTRGTTPSTQNLNTQPTLNNQNTNTQTTNTQTTQFANRNQIDSQGQGFIEPQGSNNQFLGNQEGTIGQGGLSSQQRFPSRNQNSLTSSPDVKYVRYPIRQDAPFNNEFPIEGPFPSGHNIPQRYPYDEPNRPRHFGGTRQRDEFYNRRHFFY